MGRDESWSRHQKTTRVHPWSEKVVGVFFFSCVLVLVKLLVRHQEDLGEFLPRALEVKDAQDHLDERGSNCVESD